MKLATIFNYNEILHLETRSEVDESKRRYMPLDNDTEPPPAKRNKIYERIHQFIPNAVGVLYWKEERKEMVSSQPAQHEKRSIQVPK